MKIYFAQIVFQNKPIIWELNQVTHQATCLFYCLEERFDSKKQSELLKELKKIPGIIFSDDEVVIQDIHTFDQNYIAVIEETKENQVPTLNIQSVYSKKRSSFFHNHPEAPRGTRTNSPILPKHIDLDSLIPNDLEEPTLWRNTVAYEECFLKQNISAKKMGATCLRTASSFNLLVQHEKDTLLLPEKFAVIKAIRKLLALLDPIYMEWCKTEFFNNALIINYFQKAVLDAMLNGKINNNATEFEDEEQTQLEPALRKYAIQKTLELRAELMLMKFLVLINKEKPLELVINEDTSATLLPMLTSFRQFILEQKKALLKELRKTTQEICNCIIQSRKVEHENRKLSDQLSKELATKAPVIKEFRSFQFLLQEILSGHKSESLADIITQTTTETIKQIAEVFKEKKWGQYIASLSLIIDHDFYLCPEWTKELIPVLAEIEFKKTKDDKKIKAYSNAVAEKVVDFFVAQLKEMTPLLSSASSSVTM